MPALKSKKKLFVELDQYFNTLTYQEQGLKHAKVSNETYGRQSMIYLGFADAEERTNVERFLIKEGFTVNRDYSPGRSTAEIQVSFFKGFHWDE